MYLSLKDVVGHSDPVARIEVALQGVDAHASVHQLEEGWERDRETERERVVYISEYHTHSYLIYACSLHTDPSFSPLYNSGGKHRVL